ncbi:hypothetical protein BBJ28_00001830 [Nothophytophthora sp. Chile5]|nr:hypothetical protein BBJ28_00001830 [Nothophytophthora sp. Chile5]
MSRTASSGFRLTISTLLAALMLVGIANAQTLFKASDGTGMYVFYRTDWTAPYIHYTTGSGWTTSPGYAMTASNDSTNFPAALGWFRYDLPAATSLEFVFNNGNGVWDNNANANYKVSVAGTWQLTSSVSTPPSATVLTAASDGTGLHHGQRATGDDDHLNADADHNHHSHADDNHQSYPNDHHHSHANVQHQCTLADDAGPYTLRSLTGYAHVVYGSARTSATVSVRTYLRVSSATCSYSFDGVTQSSADYQVTSSLTADLNIVVTCTDSSTTWTLKLDPVNFVWQNNAATQPSGMKGGQKGAIVDLFGWPYDDIAQECSDFLGKAGYMGVKINPPQESVLTDAWPQSGQRNPWYFVYQPVSYRLYSRLGTRTQLRSMIQTCRSNGVRVYADAVVNHMTGGGNDILSHRYASGSSCVTWGAKSSAKQSPYYTHSYTYGVNDYTGARPALEYPAVPFGPTDFHCERTLNSWTDPLQLETGWLVGLTDLNTEKTYVRERIAQYFVDLLGIGFSGLRLDALKHIGPVDAGAIYGLLSKYMGGSLPADFISWGEVIMGGEASLLACDSSSGYNFYTGLDAEYAANGISTTDIAKLKIWSSDYPKEFPICGSWILPSSRFVIQNDDHDQQNDGSSSRDMGDSGSVLIKDKDVAKHRAFEVNLFSRTDADWQIKVVLSSYTFFSNGAAGFPDGYSDCSSGFDSSQGQSCTISMPYEKAFVAGSCGYTVESFAGGKYTRVHRDLSIVNAMRSWVGLSSVSLADIGITKSCYYRRG